MHVSGKKFYALSMWHHYSDSDNSELSMCLLAGRYGGKCSKDGLAARGGGHWALLGCYHEGKIILCIEGKLYCAYLL